MELCFRARKHKYLTYFYPFVHVLHKSQGSSNREFAIINIYKGIRYFYKKHLPPWQYGIANSLLCLKAIILVIIGKVTGNTYLSQTYEKAFSIY
jgi:GT2 family glycosyltransferase